MPIDYPQLGIDHFVLEVVFRAYALNVSNREAGYFHHEAPRFRTTTDELVRAALNGRYTVTTMFEEADGQLTHCREEEWAIPRDRVLQFSTALRYLASPDSDDADFVGDAADPARVFGIADAWAQRQGLFREDESPGPG